MASSIEFLGAARNVTGSRYLLRTDGATLLIDCGLHQERHLRERDWEPLPFDAASLDAVLLTHGHLDHCGFLPRLVSHGFRGRIICTPATAEIAKIVLLDSAHIQEEDAKRKRKRHAAEGRPGPHGDKPLYTTADVDRTIPLFVPVSEDETVAVSDGAKVCFQDAGHILGSTMLRLELDVDGDPRTFVFSGDIGRWGKPILRDPTLFEKADYVVVESTYGDRAHSDPKDMEQILAEVVTETTKAGGNVVIPSFAIGRTQEILYRLNTLLLADRIPHLMMFVDSPMATKVTRLFRNHRELFDEEALALLEDDHSPFAMPQLKLVSKAADSKAINHIRGTAIIISASGMCTGGRIKHHLAHNISRRESTILFVGYQAVGTLGREILGGKKEVRILGRWQRVKARIAQIHGFSAHADRDELFRWISAFGGTPKKVFVTHGESDSAESFADLIREKLGGDVVVPSYGDRVEL